MIVTSTMSQRRSAVIMAAALWAGVGCSGPRDVEVHVSQVGFDAATRSPVVLLEDRRGRMALPIWIGPAEAQAIAMELEGQQAVRPMTHDLTKTLLAEAGVDLDRVVVESLVEGTYHARMYMRSLRRNYSVDARPSDAIALAIRFDRPIYVAAAVMESATPLDPEVPGTDRDVASVAGVTVQSLTAEIAAHFGGPATRGGVVVTDVTSPARGGPLRGDIVLAVEGRTVSTAGEFAAEVESANRRRVSLSVWREDREIRVQLQVPRRR